MNYKTRTMKSRRREMKGMWGNNTDEVRARKRGVYFRCGFVNYERDGRLNWNGIGEQMRKGHLRGCE